METIKAENIMPGWILQDTSRSKEFVVDDIKIDTFGNNVYLLFEGYNAILTYPLDYPFLLVGKNYKKK